LAIIAVAILIGPLAGGIVVLLGLLITVPVHKGTVLAGILAFGPEFGDFFLASYLFGVMPALCFGVLFCISAFRFGWNSLWAAIVVSLAASTTSPLALGQLWWWKGGRIDAKEVMFFVEMVLLPAVVAAIVCWALTQPLHRQP